MKVALNKIANHLFIENRQQAEILHDLLGDVILNYMLCAQPDKNEIEKLYNLWLLLGEMKQAVPDK